MKHEAKLNNAARDYTLEQDWQSIGEEIHSAFVAGAKWAMKQGFVDNEAVIDSYEDWGDGFARMEVCADASPFLQKSVGKYVIIQIREKDE